MVTGSAMPASSSITRKPLHKWEHEHEFEFHHSQVPPARLCGQPFSARSCRNGRMPRSGHRPQCRAENEIAAEDELTALEDKLFRVRILDTGGEAVYTYRNGLFRPVLRPDREPDLPLPPTFRPICNCSPVRKIPTPCFSIGNWKSPAIPNWG
jgi:hypothetical protein